ncbi:MAG: orotidine-5'-phosphate decarboxylase [Pseudobdellovibrio sp.]
MSLLKNPVILALDVDSKDQASKILDQVGDLVGCVKLGPRLVYRYGSEFVSQIAKSAPVFVDNKYFDIPSTMVAATRASFEAGATLVTVHALSGREALRELAKLEAELNKIRPFKILAVTILTSWTEESMPLSLERWTIEDHVKSLAKEVAAAGLSGLVCSGHELQFLNDPNVYKVIPGIRLDNSSQQDQKRVMTPSEALKAGASALVIGRPILQAQNPRETVLKILESCNR